MRKYIRASALGVGATVVALTGASAAYAAGTYVEVGGDNSVGTVPYTATNATDIVFNTNYGTKMTCTTSSISGDIFRGTEVTPSNAVGDINSLSFGGCSMGIFTLNVSMSGGDIVVRDDPSGPGADVPVTITNVSASIAATNGGTCTFNATGSVKAVIKAGDPATLELVSANYGPPETGFDLTIGNVVGCGGEVVDDDKAGPWDSDKVAGIPSSFDVDAGALLSHS